MPKPVLLVAAATRSKTLRRLVVTAITGLMIVAFSIAAPLVAVPLALSGPGGPMAVGEWGYPLAGNYSKGRGFGWFPVEGCAYCSKNHKGYDMYQGCGVTVYAAGPGRVTRAGAWDSFGNAVEINHGGGVVSIYGHMMWGSLLVHQGTPVVAGTPLGLEGTTGVSTGCHVHFEIRVNGVAVDPAIFMAARGLPLK